MPKREGIMKYVREMTVGWTMKRVDVEATAKQFCDPKTVAEVGHQMLDSSATESLLVFFLNSRNRMTGMRQFDGTVNRVIAERREIMRAALLGDAVSIIIVHNHPSGNCDPSRDDIEWTQGILACSVPLSIRLLDHVIVAFDTETGERSYYSFNEQGRLS